MSEKVKKKLPPLPFEPPDPVEILEEIEARVADIDGTIKEIDVAVTQIDQKTTVIDERFAFSRLVPQTSSQIIEQKGEKPESGKTFEGQSDEFYCLECVEGHTMKALTEIDHAIDRCRSADGRMTQGVVEKVTVAIGQVQGIVEDVKDLTNASPEVEKGLNAILEETRWIRKEYGVSGVGLTRGGGDLNDLEALRRRILEMQKKAYALVEKCPTCKLVRGYDAGKQ